MRAFTLLPLAILITGCWTLVPGQRDPTRYPWDPRNRVAVPAGPDTRVVAKGQLEPDPRWQATEQSISPESSYCIMAIEEERRSGSTVSANAGVMTCSAPASVAK